MTGMGDAQGPWTASSWDTSYVPIDRRSDLGSRAYRDIPGLVGVGFSLEAVGLLLLVAAADNQIAVKPAAKVYRLLGTAPGEQIISRFDVFRAVGFYASTTVAIVALLIAAVSLFRFRTRPHILSASRPARLSLVASTAGNVIAVPLALTVLLVRGSQHADTTGPTACLVVTGLVSLLAIQLIRQMIVRPSRRLVFQGTTIAIAVAIIAVGVSQLDISTYRLWTPTIGPAVVVPTLLPVENGFWRVTLVQHPASGAAFFSACGDADHCAIWGEGYAHRLLQSDGEVTVTADGGHTWRSWLLRQPLDTVQPFGTWPTCTGSTCVAPVIGGGFYVMTIRNDATITGRVVGTKADGGSWSCPVQTWCAGSTFGNGAPMQIASGPDMAVNDVDFPQSLVPPHTVLNIERVVCAAVGTCIVNGFDSAMPSRTPAVSPAVPRTDVLAITHDGGRSWTQPDLPAGVSPADFAASSCPDAQTCWGSIGSGSSFTGILRSSDGAASWQAETLPSHWQANMGGQLACSDAETCVLLGYLQGGGAFSATPTRYEWFRTTDGGRTWASAAPQGIPHDASLFHLSCYRSGVCLSTALSKSPRSFNQPLLIISRDGGMSWSTSPLPVPTPAPRQAMAG